MPKRKNPHAVALGRKGGLATAGLTSKRKARAARKNGKLGGRPGNPEIKRIMAALGVTRQRAHQILREEDRKVAEAIPDLKPAPRRKA